MPFTDLPSPPLDCNIVLPPPAESLYTLPRQPKLTSGSTDKLLTSAGTSEATDSNLIDQRTVRFEGEMKHKLPLRMKRSGSNHTESVV